MPFPFLAAGSLLAKGLSSLFSHRSQDAQHDEDARARVALLNLLQKRSEDSRIGHLKLGSSVLGSIPKTTQNGAVQTHIWNDPALLAELEKERTYNFGDTIPESKGGFDSFLTGLFGGAADTIPRIAQPPAGTLPGIDSTQVAGGFSPAPTGGPSSPNTGPNITLEQLLAEDPAKKAL